MLELIVLGLVPGTHIQLTFFQVVLTTELIVLVFAIIQETRALRAFMRGLVTPKTLKKLLN